MRPEHWIYTVPLRLRSLFRRRQVDRELDLELQYHVEERTDQNVAKGMTRQEARRAALLEIGGVETRKEECRDTRRVTWLQDLLQDLRYGFRMVRKSPGFTAVAVLTLALGIGANTAIFSFIDAVLLRDLPLKDPQQLVVFVWSARVNPKLHGHSGYGDCANGHGDCSFSVPFFKTIRAADNSFSGVAAFAGPLDVDLSGNGAASIAQGTFVSGDFFSTLGVSAFAGRPLTPADDTPSAPPTIVLDYGYWVRAFGADRSVVGRTVNLDNVPVTIVGVADPHFTNLTPGKPQDFFMAFSLSDRVRGERRGNENRLTDARDWWVVMLGRLTPGVSVGQAQVAATTIFRNVMLHGSTPFFKSEDAPVITLLPAEAGLNGETIDIAPTLYLTMIIVAFILLIACANVAGLALARSATRQKEMAVRLALGAGRARIVRQLLTESILLSVIGGALGILFAVWGVDTITNLFAGAAGRPFPFVVAPDWRVLTFTITVTLATGILFGLAPAIRGARVDLTPSLKESASSLPGGAVHTRRWFRLGHALVVAQVALSIVVLIGTGLLVRTLRNFRDINPGFDTRNILLFGINPTIAGYTDQRTTQLYNNLQQRFAALPGVISASYSEDALLNGGWPETAVHLDGAPPKQNIHTKELRVGLKFFSTMRIPILAGRAFNSADFTAATTTSAAYVARFAAATIATSNPASPLTSAPAASSTALDQAYDHAPPIPAIINEAFARKFLPNKNPIGMHMGLFQRTDSDVQNPGPGYTIVGIAGDTKYAYLNRETVPILFLPVVGNSAYFELRTAANPAALVKTVREIVSQAGDNLPLTNVRTQTEQIEQLLFQQRLLSKLSSFFGGLALVLACIGLYGLLSYEVAQRTQEIGVRAALGAQPLDVMKLVLGEGAKLVLAGLVAGILGAVAATRLMTSLLFGVSATDPWVFVSVAILLPIVALAACYIPARRATRIDPLVAMRCE